MVNHLNQIFCVIITWDKDNDNILFSAIHLKAFTKAARQDNEKSLTLKVQTKARKKSILSKT